MIKDILKDTEQKMQKAVEAVKREFAEVRTGRAHPGLVEGLHIDYYGTPTMLKQLANISVPDPRTITIQLWDASVIEAVEKAIAQSKLAVTPMVDGKTIRINLPPLSEERREEMFKMAKEMAEHGRVSIRTIRREANERIKKEQSAGHIPEDDAFRAIDEVQKLTDRYIKIIDQLLDEKHQDLAQKH